VSNPFENIKDGYKFQQIIAEYFRSLKHEKHDYHISDIQVEDNGVGGDDGCDILVEFYFEDPIYKHTQKWVIECKSQKKAVGPDSSKGANGYLLVCKNDATASLKRMFENCSKESNKEFIIWNGSQLWHKFIKSKSLIQAFFPKYYQDSFQNNNAEDTYNELVKKYENKILGEDKK
jgi:hypothetical protein